LLGTRLINFNFHPFFRGKFFSSIYIRVIKKHPTGDIFAQSAVKICLPRAYSEFGHQTKRKNILSLLFSTEIV